MVVRLRGSRRLLRARGQVNFIAAELDVTPCSAGWPASGPPCCAALDAEGLLEAQPAPAVPPVPRASGWWPARAPRDTATSWASSSSRAWASRSSRCPPGAGAAAPRRRWWPGPARAGGAGATSWSWCAAAGQGRPGRLRHRAGRPGHRHLPVPVWTGIGHTGDESVADLVANRAFITPTECGQELAGRVGAGGRAVAGPADRVARPGRRGARATPPPRPARPAPADQCRGAPQLAGTASAWPPRSGVWRRAPRGSTWPHDGGATPGRALARWRRASSSASRPGRVVAPAARRLRRRAPARAGLHADPRRRRARGRAAPAPHPGVRRW